ncbi:uncharacterized protein N7498_007721 [Penicillium cinerascens]|uniref:Uncharacterized protein n=1 Tax=Penicillium cinerascens TaxID=70096 RepID=A0A9W9JLM8_9EURO|nr:uncharacterized protein N7498_007721 [Penicillium cinerascens]KAJ5198604.1 hypothetical protein N7498_007721 [Penicillium cinerascens]
MSMRPETLETIIKNEGPHEADDAPEGEMKHSEIRKIVETHHAGLVDAAELVKLGPSHFLLELEPNKPKHLDKQQRTRGEAQTRDAEARGGALVRTGTTLRHASSGNGAAITPVPASFEAYLASEKSGDEYRFTTDPDVRQNSSGFSM